MKKIMFLLLALLVISIGYSATYVDANGNQITQYNFSPSALGYVEIPNGFAHVCNYLNIYGDEFGLTYSGVGLSNETYVNVSVSTINVTSVTQTGFYCATINTDLSPLKAVFPGKVDLIDYSKGNVFDLNLLDNGSYYAYITSGNGNITLSFSRILDQNGNDILTQISNSVGLNSNKIGKLILLELVNLNSHKVVSEKLVSPGESIVFAQPSDFINVSSSYGTVYLFYANGLPVHLEKCTPCTGKPDGTKCSFNLNAKDYGCVNTNGNGVCVGGVCRPLCDPSENYVNKIHSTFGKYFNDYCYKTTGQLGWYGCCAGNNQYHVCTSDPYHGCTAFCGDKNLECCSSSTPCNPGLTCACTLTGKTKCVKSWEPDVIFPWNLFNGKVTEFVFNNPIFGLLSCCAPGSGCAVNSKLPSLCPVKIH